MKISGLTDFTLIDFPDTLSCIVFVQGCNLSCSFCYNKALISKEYPKGHEGIPQEEVIEFLKSRVGKLEGVSVSGGEPTLQPDLKDFLSICKSLGYKTKVDTNGTQPDVIRDLINSKVVDYIAMDVKSPYDKFKQITFCGDLFITYESVLETIEILKTSGIKHHFRVTVPESIENKELFVQKVKDIVGEKLVVQKQVHFDSLFRI